jgi:phosphatidylglycerol:prolipoprotein diacylglycerol transferase
MVRFMELLLNIDPIAYRIGPFAVRWYGLSYVVGVIIAASLFWFFAKRWDVGISADDFLTCVLCGTIGIMVGGRLFYCFVYGGTYYFENPLQILNTLGGGMSFHGSLIGGLLMGLVAARIVKIPALTLLELGFIGAPIGLGIGRVTNFINQELWGRVTDLPWGIVFANAGPLPRHPSQLYQALMEGFVLGAIMIAVAMKVPAPRPGTVLATFLMGYGVFRIIGETFREPDAQLGFLVGGWLTMGMLLSIAMVVGGIALMVWSNTGARRAAC